MNLKTRNQRQLEEANSPVNRWYFGEKYNREPLDFWELFEFYVNSGGAENFAIKAREEEDEQETH